LNKSNWMPAKIVSNATTIMLGTKISCFSWVFSSICTQQQCASCASFDKVRAHEGTHDRVRNNNEHGREVRCTTWQSAALPGSRCATVVGWKGGK
jgi:hypothetical protein